MRISSLFRVATVALSLVALTGVATTGAFAASRVQQQYGASTYTGPYDSPDFVVAPSDIHS
ncbi:MAG TPA: hypothetical protein VGP48_08045 [Stellaceae bacterium]|jgi:hypothetical protein|nr:hypothetical protein [Stellaceae bacterium]